MFNKLVPVVALARLAGPVVAADAPATAPAAEQPAAPAKSHHKKHGKKPAKSAASKTDQSNAPAKYPSLVCFGSRAPPPRRGSCFWALPLTHAPARGACGFP